jgi:hypothetical protein
VSITTDQPEDEEPISLPPPKLKAKRGRRPKVVVTAVEDIEEEPD